MIYTIALFGEAERGEFNTDYFCQNLAQLGQSPLPKGRSL